MQIYVNNAKKLNSLSFIIDDFTYELIFFRSSFIFIEDVKNARLVVVFNNYSTSTSK